MILIALLSLLGGSAAAFDITPAPSTTLPFISLSSPTNNPILTTGFASIYWVNVDSNTSMGFDAVASSDTVTVPSAGRYQVNCLVYTTAATTTLSARIRANGITVAQVDIDPISGSTSSAGASKILDLNSGATLQCQGYDTGGGYWSTSSALSSFQVYKLQ